MNRKSTHAQSTSHSHRAQHYYIPRDDVIIAEVTAPQMTAITSLRARARFFFGGSARDGCEFLIIAGYRAAAMFARWWRGFYGFSCGGSRFLSRFNSLSRFVLGIDPRLFWLATLEHRAVMRVWRRRRRSGYKRDLVYVYRLLCVYIGCIVYTKLTELYKRCNN